MIFYWADYIASVYAALLVIDWFTNYVSNSHQIVRLGDQHSVEIEVKQVVYHSEECYLIYTSIKYPTP